MSDDEKNPTVGHEQSDVPARIPVLFFIFIAGFVPVALLILWGLVSTVWKELPGPPNPFAGEQVGAPEVPLLQGSPETDLVDLNRRMRERLHGVGWVDQETERVHMPIERAMQLLVERGLPERGAHANQATSLAELPISKGVNAATETKVNIKAARAVAEPNVVIDPRDGQEAGNE